MDKLSTLLQVIICVIPLVMVIVFTVLIHVFYKNYKKNFLPVHIFQLNLGISYTTRVLFFLYVAILRTDIVTKMFQSTFNVCQYYVFGLFIFLANEVDTIVMQIDRIVAVHYSFQYRAWVTNTKVLAICLTAKVLAALILGLALLIDTNYSDCVDYFGYFYTKPVSIIFISIPQLIITIGVIAVSISLGSKIVKFKSSVAPVVTLSTIATTGNFQDNASTQADVRIRRQDEEPDMFYRMAAAPNSNVSSVMKNEGKDTTKSVFNVAKESLNANYIVIFFCLANTPLSISSIAFHGCHQRNNDCDFFMVLYRYLILFRTLAVLPCLLTVIYKIKKNSP